MEAKQIIEIDRDMKIILIQALKDGQVNAEIGQQIADYFCESDKPKTLADWYNCNRSNKNVKTN